MTKTSTEHRYLDRAPQIGDTVTVTPKGEALFEVIALDDLYGQLIYVARGDEPGQWIFLTHVKVIDDEPASTDCTCGHPGCGAC